MRGFHEKDLRARFISFALEKELILSGDRLLCAHSGGSDSTFLFEMLLKTRDELGFEFSAAHVNHGLRGKAADEDEEFVRARCEAEGIRFLRRAVAVDEIRDREGVSLEMAARRLRYGALEEMSVEAGCNKVVFAHQVDDRIETFLLRLLKGAGPDGLASIPIRRPMGEIELIRPLFAFSRTEIIEWLKTERIEYRVDKSNLDKSIARNAIREDLLPHLEEHFNPSVRKAFLHTIEALERDSEYINHIAITENTHRYVEAEDGLILDLTGLEALDTPVIVRMLLETFTRLAGEDYRSGYDHLTGAVNLWLGGKRNDRIDFPGGWTSIRVDKGLHIRPTPQFKQPPTIEKEIIIREGEYALPEIFTVTGKIIPLDKITDLKHQPTNTVYLKAELAGKLTIDYNRIPGRFIRPLGMGGHKHKVSDIVSRAGIPKHMRDWIPLILDSGDSMEIIAIPHMGLISETAKVGEKDGKIFSVGIAPPMDSGVL